MEVNASLLGALFTDQSDSLIRVFCFYTNGSTSSFDVPADSNVESLHRLFARLDMVDQCTSVILDKVVQGRVYVEHKGELVSYTLLTAPGNTLPQITPELCDLPWKRIWASPEAEVLELGVVGQPLHCYAVRSRVSDVEAKSLYRSSNAFISPIPAVHRPWRNPVLAGAAAGAILLLVGAGVFMALNTEKPVASAVAPPVVVRARPAPAVPEVLVQMLHEQKISGPFTMQELQKKSGGGSVSDAALFRIQGTSEWVPFEKLAASRTPTDGPGHVR